MIKPKAICFWLERQRTFKFKPGGFRYIDGCSMANRTKAMKMTTNTSSSVKADAGEGFCMFRTLPLHFHRVEFDLFPAVSPSRAAAAPPRSEERRGKEEPGS